MVFRQLFDGATSSYTYLVADEATGQAAIIDPVLEQVERDAQLVTELGLRLAYVLETHVHADHITGATRLKERFGARLVGLAPCSDLPPRGELAVGGLTLRVIETPGHTAGCVTYALPDRVFTGDALLVRTCGRTDFQGGDPGVLYDSITTRLFTLPDETLVYPAHDYKGHTVSSIGEEKRLNVRLANRSREAFVQLMNNLNLAMPRKIDEALPANLACGCLPGQENPT